MGFKRAYKWAEEIPVDEYIRLYYLEKTLRRIVVEQLSKIDEKWWLRRVPEEIRQYAERRKREEMEKLVRTQDFHPIWYVDFTDYVAIITRRDNWNEVFKSIFRNKEHFKAAIEMLSPIRNKIAHMRPLSEREITNLIALSEDILVAIWEQAYNRKYVKPAEEFMKNGRFFEAENILLKGFEETSDPWIAYKLAELYLQTRDFKKAKYYLNFAYRHFPLPRYKKMAKNKLNELKNKEFEKINTK